MSGSVCLFHLISEIHSASSLRRFARANHLPLFSSSFAHRRSLDLPLDLPQIDVEQTVLAPLRPRRWKDKRTKSRRRSINLSTSPARTTDGTPPAPLTAGRRIWPVFVGRGRPAAGPLRRSRVPVLACSDFWVTGSSSSRSRPRAVAFSLADARTRALYSIDRTRVSKSTSPPSPC
jgi:hypothetical protein